MIQPAEAQSADVEVAGWSLGASAAANFTYYVSRARGIVDHALKAPVPIKSLVTWDPNVDLKVGIGVIRASYPIRTVDTNVQKYHNFYQRRAGTSEFDAIDAQGLPAGKKRLSVGIADVTIIGNTVPTNLPVDRVTQTRVDTLLANTGEERDRINGGDAPGDLDPVYHLGETGYRLFGNLSRRNGVNHKTLTWYAWRMSRDDLA